MTRQKGTTIQRDVQARFTGYHLMFRLISHRGAKAALFIGAEVTDWVVSVIDVLCSIAQLSPNLNRFCASNVKTFNILRLGKNLPDITL